MSTLTLKTIHLAADHAGFAHKEMVREWLLESGVKVVDHGAYTFDAEDDFPDFIGRAAAAVSQAPLYACGIIFGGSGQGEAMLANRFSNVRTTVYYGGQPEIITLSRGHNDANILSIGARFVTEAQTKQVIEAWLQAPVLPDEKYGRRNQKIEKITKEIRSL